MHPSSKEHITFTSPKALLAERMPANASALWFTAPTVQRLLRSVGAEETFLTGNGADFEKFSVLLSSLPALRGSALAEAVAAELTAFGAPSTTADAAALWQLLSTQPAEEDAPPLSRSAADTLLPFSPEKLSEFANYPQNGVEKLSVRPILHPDPLLMANRRGFAARMKEFGQSVGVEIRDLASLTLALGQSIKLLISLGGDAVLHDELLKAGFVRPDPYHAEETFRRALESDGRGLSPQEAALLHTQFLRIIGKLCLGMKLRAVLLAPAADTIRSTMANGDFSDTVSARFSENGFCALVNYLAESTALPSLIIGLSPDAPAGLLPRLAGRIPTENGAPYIHWGIDGRNATAADMEIILRAILRHAGAGAYVGVLVEETGFFTAPRTRLLADREATLLGCK